jgi:flavin-dependent dehydrogenase
VLSGERFLLCGDAGSLSNPVSGTGMGNAMVSGKLAGEQALQCLYKNKFDAKFMRAYDAQIDKHIIQYLMKTFKYQRFVSKLPFVMQLVFGLGQNNAVKRYIQRVV